MLNLKDRWIRSRLEIVGTALIVGSLFSIVLAYAVETQDHKDALLAIATGALGAGVFAWLTKLAQLSGVFSQEIEAIIYGERHLSNRKDKEKLWINATRSLYGDRFPDLQKRLTPETLRSVWPSEERFYLVNCRRTVTLELVDREKGVIAVTHSLVSDLVTDTGDRPVVRRSSYEFNINGLSKDEIAQLISDGRSTYSRKDEGKKPIQDEAGKPKKMGDNWRKVIYEAKLSPGKVYEVKESSKHNQTLEFDNVSGFVAMSYVDGLNVAINYPKRDLNVQFMSVGPVDFTDCDPKLADIHKETKDLLFSDVGCLITIQLKGESL